MGHPIPRISTPTEKDVERRAGDRVRLFERLAIGEPPADRWAAPGANRPPTLVGSGVSNMVGCVV